MRIGEKEEEKKEMVVPTSRTRCLLSSALNQKWACWKVLRDFSFGSSAREVWQNSPTNYIIRSIYCLQKCRIIMVRSATGNQRPRSAPRGQAHWGRSRVVKQKNKEGRRMLLNKQKNTTQKRTLGYKIVAYRLRQHFKNRQLGNGDWIISYLKKYKQRHCI